MDIKELNEQKGTPERPLEIVRRLEHHYGCGCSTTRIESLRSQAADLKPACPGHSARLVRSVETVEYRERL
jgi:hypothetical protein